MSEQPTGLAAALAAVQAQLPVVRKGETAQVRSQKGNYSYQYADLATVSHAILPLLGQHGLAWITRPTLSEGKFVLAYELVHTSGEFRGGEYPLGSGTPQEIGSAITYARRYALCSVTGVAPESDDDDGATAAPASRDRWEDARAVPDEEARQKIRANAAIAIGAAPDRGALEVIGERINKVEQGVAITREDALELRRALVARLEELYPTASTEEGPA